MRRRIARPQITKEKLKKLQKLNMFLIEIDEKIFKSKEYFKLGLNKEMLPENYTFMAEFDSKYEHAISKPPLIKPNNELLKTLLERGRIEFGEPLVNAKIPFAPLADSVKTLIYMSLLNHNQGGIESLFLLSQEKLLIDEFCYGAILNNTPKLIYDFDRIRVLAEFHPRFLNGSLIMMSFSRDFRINGCLYGLNLNEAAYYVALGARQANLDAILTDPNRREESFSLTRSVYSNAICYAEDYRHEISLWVRELLLADLIKTVAGYLGENIYSLPSRDDMASYQPKPFFFPNIGLPLVLVQMILAYVEGERTFLSEETEEAIQKIWPTEVSTTALGVSTCPGTTFAARQNHVVTRNDTVSRTLGMDKY